MFLERIPERLDHMQLIRVVRVAQGDLRLRRLHATTVKQDPVRGGVPRETMLA